MVKYRLSAPGTSRNWPRVMSPTPGRSTLITSAPNQASNCVQVGPDCTCVKSRMRTPSSALPAWPQGLDDGRGKLPFAALAGGFLAATFAVLFTGLLAADLMVFLPDFFAGALDFFARGLDFAFVRVAIALLPYFLRILLCGLRLPMRPLSLPAAGSITALTNVGRPESIASLTARLSSSGVVTRTPTPPNASIIFS